MNKTTAATIVRAYLVLLCIYALYQAYSYTGIYRWLAEWQLAQSGSYNLRFTVAASILLPAVPVCLVAEIFRVPYRTGWRRSDPSKGGPTTHLKWIAIFGVLALAVAASSFVLGSWKSAEPAVIETVDLPADKPPQSNHVRMSGLARTDMIVTLDGPRGRKFYLPLTASNWKRSDAIVYFLQTNVDAYLMPDGHTLSLDANTPPFRITVAGVLVPNDLPGPVAEIYRKRNLALASPPMVLELSAGADLTPYWVVAGVGTLLGLVCLFVAGLGVVQQRRAGTRSTSG